MPGHTRFQCVGQPKYTPEQLQVIEHRDGHAVVSAVAGSGKTETLIGRVRHLLRDHGPAQIAVVMFNRDAADSFRRRFEERIGGPMPEIRTFNSMGNKIVNRLVAQGFLPEAKLQQNEFVRTRMAREAFLEVYKRFNQDDEEPGKELIDGFVSFVGLVKSDAVSAQATFESGRYTNAAKSYPEAFDAYEQARTHAKVRFFEDQLYDPVMLLLKQQEHQRLVANKVDHLIVDEAQDMNGIQIALLRMLAGTRAKVMIVGDDDQSIYEWRGAKPDYIIRGFEHDFPNAKRYTLPHTFRFGHTLSLAASHLITHNANRSPKISISSADTPDTAVHSLELGSDTAGLGERIQSLVASGRTPSEIAVLVRTYDLALGVDLELHHLGVPHFVYGRPPLIRIPEVSAMLGVLRLAAGRLNALDVEEARFILKSLLQRPPLYLNKPTLEVVVERAAKAPNDLSNAIRSAITANMQPFQADQVRARADLLEVIATRTGPKEGPVDVLDRYLQGTDFTRAIRRKSPTPEDAELILGNVAALREHAARHRGTISQFLDDIDPLIDSVHLEPPAESHVWIGSIHRAKGAEWPVVFVPGLADGSFPRRELTKAETEAERRLCYVAMTRAIDELYLVHPKDPAFTQSVDDVDAEPSAPPGAASPFLWEIDLAIARYAGRALTRQGPFSPKNVRRPTVANEYFQRFAFAKGWLFGKRELRPASPPSLDHKASSTLDEGLRPGTRLEHKVFGKGTLQSWVDQRVFRVRFDNGDTRMFVADASPIKLL
jgi:DNA helicase II / ATP-dependent DNA helicase PcrA